MDKIAMIRGAILAMQIDNDTKTQLFSYLDELEERELWLCALEAAGVDNWSGYEYAQKIIEEYVKTYIDKTR